jgi:hypothetical protein
MTAARRARVEASGDERIYYAELVGGRSLSYDR